MAIGDSNLLNLLLAYSASHRARYLGHPEPANRIAHWVSKVFPTLRMALESSSEDITDSHLATAIMLLSLKIVSPRTFEVPITWKSHLKLLAIYSLHEVRVCRSLETGSGRSSPAGWATSTLWDLCHVEKLVLR